MANEDAPLVMYRLADGTEFSLPAGVVPANGEGHDEIIPVPVVTPRGPATLLLPVCKVETFRPR
jgi:hypothetical protein